MSAKVIRRRKKCEKMWMLVQCIFYQYQCIIKICRTIPFLLINTSWSDISTYTVDLCSDISVYCISLSVHYWFNVQSIPEGNCNSMDHRITLWCKGTEVDKQSYNLIVNFHIRANILFWSQRKCNIMMWPCSMC